MKAVLLDYDRRSLRIGEAAEPQIQRDDEVLLRVAEVGVCGTDRELALFHFGYPPGGEQRLILGHEALGRVVSTGSAATGQLRAGDWVVPMIRRPCHPPCAECARGRRDLCLTGRYTERGLFGEHGYFCDLAVDRAGDLIRIEETIVPYAVLLEPLSTVEKAIETALRLHAGGAERALVLGAGPIGLLAAVVLRLRGFRVVAHSLEPAGHPRVRLLERAGIEYRTGLDPESADVIVEATGSPDAPAAALAALRRQGVLMLLGAPFSRAELPFRDMIVRNQVIAGSVNASPQAFAAAAADLGRLPRPVLDGLIERRPFDDYRRSILEPSGGGAPKLVHVVNQLH